MNATAVSGSLSVPSSRVEPLQLPRANKGSGRTQPFSTLKPGRTSATISIERVKIAYRPFSTLKPGRTSATRVAACNLCLDHAFQYPQAGSNLCNQSIIAASSRTKILSVPSSRVEPLQRGIAQGLEVIGQTFSTLKPGRTSATLSLSWTHPIEVTFSTLKPGRTSATH